MWRAINLTSPATYCRPRKQRHVDRWIETSCNIGVWRHRASWIYLLGGRSGRHRTNPTISSTHTPSALPITCRISNRDREYGDPQPRPITCASSLETANCMSPSARFFVTCLFRSDLLLGGCHCDTCTRCGADDWMWIER